MGVLPRRSAGGPATDGGSSRFSALWSRSSGQTYTQSPAGAEPAGSAVDVGPPPGSGLKPSAMRGSEPLYGYVVGLELLVVAVLNLTVTHGKGAPAHPQTTLAAIGVVTSLGFVAVIRLKNRMAAGFGAIVAAFFVTLPRVPNSMAIAHIFALVIPMAYGLIITQRQRRDTPKLARGARGAGAGGAKSSAGTGQVPSGGRRRGRKTPEPVSGPRQNARYTPPKSKQKPSGR